MIFITAKFRMNPSMPRVARTSPRPFTTATRAEPGCLWFDWSRSVEDPGEYVLVEAFRDADSGGAHVQSGHFAEHERELPPLPGGDAEDHQPAVDQDDWSELGELAVDPAG